jgi:hypothetical protein
MLQPFERCRHLFKVREERPKIATLSVAHGKYQEAILNLSEVLELIKLISEKDLAEFEQETEGARLKVKKAVVVAAVAANNNLYQRLCRRRKRRFCG